MEARKDNERKHTADTRTCSRRESLFLSNASEQAFKQDREPPTTENWCTHLDLEGREVVGVGEGDLCYAPAIQVRNVCAGFREPHNIPPVLFGRTVVCSAVRSLILNHVRTAKKRPLTW